MHIGPHNAVGIEGMEGPEGDALFREAWEEVVRVMKPYYHEWKPTDMVAWDNLRCLHCATGHDPAHEGERLLHRTTIDGDYGLGRFENGATPSEPARATM